MKTKNFRKKLSIACGNDDLRSALQYISFNDGYAICTDAHILVKQSLKEHSFTEDEIKIMNGKFLHKNAFNEVFRFDYVTVSEDGFTCRKSNVKSVIGFSDLDERLPNYMNVLNELKKPVELSEIGFSSSLLKKISDVSLSYIKSHRLKFYGKNKGVLFSPTDVDENDETILIMPIQLNN